MTDELKEPVLVKTKDDQQATSASVTPQAPKRSKKILWIVAAIVFLCCLCSVLCLVLGGLGFGRVLVEKAPIAQVLDEFMLAMDAKDVDEAYALLSPRSQRQTPRADVERMVQGNNYKLFEGYESLTVDGINLSATVHTNPDAPRGTVANVSGTITYAGGYRGTFTAVLEKVDGVWMLFFINVQVPPDKFDNSGEV